TNLNQGRRIRKQIIDQVEKGQSYSTDFYDIPARYDRSGDEYGVDILLKEVGYFEFKVRVESARRNQPWAKWADGPNVGISVWPIEYARNNSIYCAFIRQFDAKKSLANRCDEQLEQTIIDLEKKGAHVIGPGGDFKDFMEELSFIIDELGMKIIHLLPINPIPSSYGRMGMYGSPYATNDYFGIDPTYATFSHYQTIEEQFTDLTSTIHDLGGKVILDMVINHTGWAGSIHFTHRHWRKTGKDGKIISPGAWGVVWGDLVELDYRHQDLWQYMANVFKVWCSRGINGFRLDAGYMVPLEVWRYIISKIRQEYPNTLFLLEGLGGPWETTETLLTEGQMNWAYSELFQNYSRRQILDYLEYAQKVSSQKGILVHYAETHDNDRLAKKGREYARMRVFISALTSFAGAWGFSNGVEWLANEKIDVHRNTGLNWGGDDNLVEDIAWINDILATNAAFWECDNLDPADLGDDELLALIRCSTDRSNIVIILINLNAEQEKTYRWDLSQGNIADLFESEVTFIDLLDKQSTARSGDKVIEGSLSPGGCLLYRLVPAGEPSEITIPAVYEIDPNITACIYRILLSRFHSHEVGRIEQEELLRQVHDYRKFIALINTTSLRRLMQGKFTEDMEKIDDETIERFSSVWSFDDRNKEFILSGDKWLVVHTYLPCTAYLKTKNRTIILESIPRHDESGHQVYFPPQPENENLHLTFNWKFKEQGVIRRKWQDVDYPILSVPSGRTMPRSRKIYPLKLEKSQLQDNLPTVVLTNGIGGISQFPARPGRLNSKYDGLLCITPDQSNLNYRLVLAKMIQETIQVGNKCFDLDDSFLNSFTRYPQPLWEFIYDDGEYYIRLERSIVMPPGENTVFLRYRLRESNTVINMIGKCYVQCISCHDQLKADPSLRNYYESCCAVLKNHPGVQFGPQEDVVLQIAAQKGEFIHQPHWISDMDFPLESQRGLDSKGDVFSPGFFNFKLNKGDGQVIVVTAEPEKIDGISYPQAVTKENKRIKELLEDITPTNSRHDPLVRMLILSLDQFIVHTDMGAQMIAGLPWLGVNVKDALHCVKGLLVAGRIKVARDIILNCSQTEKHGLLADWLGTASISRTNIEASLRLFLAAHDYVKSTGEDSLWSATVTEQISLRDVLVGIYEQFCDDNAGGISLDQSTGLLYCPEGYTWMNTQHPRCTPRAGYPIEIQALWYQILPILADIYPPYAEQANQIRELINRNFISLFWNEAGGYLTDVLRAIAKIPAAQATADSCLRFNQLAALQAGLAPLEYARQVVDTIANKLLVPAGVRSLSEDPLQIPLEIINHDGRLLADPRLPYQSRCIGDETARRLAYHNGSAWPWVYPNFIETRAAVYHFSDLAVRQSLAFFEPVALEMASGGIGALAQIKDGNYPHAPRGCYGYALSVAETLRVYLMLKYHHPDQHTFPETAQTCNAKQK
ncbi:MAG: hypothetical protein GY869_20955, partial [Planctomycetes bacterium]|nr:hypothetical protein [Planctomycetota bacterium]